MNQTNIDELPISRKEFNETLRKEHGCFTNLYQKQQIEINELKSNVAKLKITIHEMKLENPTKDVNEVF